ncbi:MAG: hypothetical protein K8S94_06160 [Planctomycetia bacterium]|nr:hypothetical protein [Planctomycetia bacterium]
MIDVDDDGVAGGAGFDPGHGPRRGEALPLHRPCRPLTDGGEQRLASGERTGEQQQFIIGLERPREPLRIDVDKAPYDGQATTTNGGEGWTMRIVVA